MKKVSSFKGQVSSASKDMALQQWMQDVTSLLCYQPEVPHAHKESLVKALDHYNKRCTTGMKKVSSFKGQVSSDAAARKKVLSALKRGAKSGGLGFATAEMCHRMVQDSGTWTDMQWLAMEMQIMALGST